MQPLSRARLGAICTILFAMFLASPIAPSQTTPIGLPVVFVHGICDSPDSFLPAEKNLMQYLQQQQPDLYPTSTVPNQYPNTSIDWVAFYNGQDVWFQRPQVNGVSSPAVKGTALLDKSARFFLVSLNDPSVAIPSASTQISNDYSYKLFKRDAVASLRIYEKGYELAQIIWKIKSLTGAPRVIVIGHSMGGLDSRAYIEGLASPTGTQPAAIPYYNDLAALVTLDTPHGGAYEGDWWILTNILNLGVQLVNECAGTPTVNRAEMASDGVAPSIIPQLNYTSRQAGAQPLPSALTITSITSSWSHGTNPIFPLSVSGNDNVVWDDAQDMEKNIPAENIPSPDPMKSITNSFFGYGTDVGFWCGSTEPLHVLDCTGSASMTFQSIQEAVGPYDSVSTGSFQITPADLTVASGSSSTTFTTSDGTPVIWSILEGLPGGKVNAATGQYVAPANHSPSAELFHIVAISTADPAQYAETTVTVSSSPSKTPSQVVLSAPSQYPIGAALTMTATVIGSGGTPTGNVDFYDNGLLLRNVVVNNGGVASFATSALSVGSHSLTANYAGDTNFLSSTTDSATQVTIVEIDPQLSVSPSTGAAGTTSFTKFDTGFSPGQIIRHTVTLPDKTQSTLDTSSYSDGNYQYSRTYDEIGSYTEVDMDLTTGKTTSPQTWTVLAPVTNDFSLQATPTSQTVIKGAQTAYTVFTSVISGSDQLISIGATNLPSGVTASFSPNIFTSGSYSTLTVSVGSAAAPGAYAFTIMAIGEYATHTIPVVITVTTSTSSAGVLASSPMSFNFNPQTVGTASSPFVFSLVNQGGTSLTITSLTTSSGFVPSFLNGVGLPITLQPNGGYANMQVVFIPSQEGTISGVIQLFNSTNASPLTLSVSGQGLAGPITSGNIQIQATFNGSPWSGNLFTNLWGPASYTDGGAPITHTELAPGSYSESYSAGGPGGAILSSITPSPSQTLTAGSTITFTYNFTGTNTFNIGDPQPITTVMGTGKTAQIQLPQLCLVTGAAQTIQVAMQGLPLGANVAWSANPLSLTGCGQDETATITTSDTTSPGVYKIQITGTNQGGSSSTTSAWLSVNLPPASPDVLVSVASNRTQGNGDSGRDQTGEYLSLLNAVSADGRVVAFVSMANNLAPLSGPAFGTVPQIYVRDSNANATILASAAADGTQANYGALYPALSTDGRYLAFQSYATNLPNASSGGNNAVYIRDLIASTITRVDMAPDGTPGNGISYNPSLSADGRFAAFHSTASNLIPGVNGGIFVLDRKTGQFRLASVSSDGSDPTSGDVPKISASGRYVTFASSDPNLVPNDTNGHTDAFVHDFVTGETTRVNVSSDGTQDNCGVLTSIASPLTISADGRYVAFYSCGDLVSGYADPRGDGGDVYLHDMVTGQTFPLGIDQLGDLLNTQTVGGFSADGRFIAVNGSIIDLTTGQMTRVDVLSDGSGSPAFRNTAFYGGDTTTAFLSSDGSHTIFASNASNLVSNDNNGYSDVFEGVNSFLGSPRLASISLSASQASGGASVAGTLTLNAPAPSGGAAVSVWTDSDSASVPAVVMIPGGSSSAQFTLTTSPVTSEVVLAVLASFGGGSGATTFALQPGGLLTVDPQLSDFGYQQVGTASVAQSFVLNNFGTEPLALNSIQLSTGTEFVVSGNNCPANLTPGSSCSVSVEFNPTVSGSVTDSLVVNFGSPASTQSISLSGSGSVAIVSLPGLVSLGNVIMPGTAQGIAALANTGNAPLGGILASISGPNAQDFTASLGECSSGVLPPDSTCSLSITFSPKAAGARTATLNVTGQSFSAPITATLTANGKQTTPVINWTTALPITYGTALSSTQLDATANVPGTFVYIPPPGTIPVPGLQTLSVTFTPTDSSDYTTATKTVQLSVHTTTTSSQLQFIPVTPCRIADTRNSAGSFGGPQLAANSTRTFDIPQSACGIPSTAVAYSLNATVVPSGSLNYLTLWAAGQAQPYVSTLNSDGRIKANAAIIPAGTNGGVSVYVTNATHFILDIDGYFVPAGTDSSALQFFPVTPCRIADTRNSAGPLGGPTLSGGTSRDFPILSSRCIIPSTAQAYSLNITAVPHGPLNYLAAWPSGQAKPWVSTLNASTGAVTANAAIVPAGTGGDISIFVYNDADVILDVNGYFAPPATGGLSLYTVTPCRVIDTRYGAGAFQGTLAVPVQTSSCAPPATAQAYVLNATVVPPGSLNYLSLWPDGAAKPNVSTLNANDGAITSNMALVPTTNGKVDSYAYNLTNLILDLSSYFAP
jgi:hypothetical protein